MYIAGKADLVNLGPGDFDTILIPFVDTFGKFFRSYSELLSKFGDISFQEYVFKGISHPVF